MRDADSYKSRLTVKESPGLFTRSGLSFKYYCKSLLHDLRFYSTNDQAKAWYAFGALARPKAS